MRALLVGGAALLCCLTQRVAHGQADEDDSDGQTEASADDDWGANDSLGFADTAVSETAANDTPTAEPSHWSLNGTLRLRGAIGTEQQSPRWPAKAQPSLDAALTFADDVGGGAGELRMLLSGHAEYDFVYLSRERFDRPTLDVYEWQLWLQESYLALRLSAFELAVGRQIVNWGQGEVLSILEPSTPRDLREPGLADLGDLRLPALMTRAGYVTGELRFELLVQHEPRFSLLPPPLGNFSPMRRLLLEVPGFEQGLAGRPMRFTDQPPQRVDNLQATQWQTRLSWSGHGVDLRLHAGSVLEQNGVPRFPEPAAFADEEIALPLHHPRYQFIGHSGALPIASLLLRWELALNFDRPLSVLRTDTPLIQVESERHHQLDGLLGITYVVSASTTAGLELVQSYVFDGPAQRNAPVRALWPIDKPQLAMRVGFGILQDRVTVQALLLAIGLWDLNALAGRIQLGYAPIENVRVELGFMTYQPTDEFGPFYGFEHNDRVFLTLRWDFAL